MKDDKKNAESLPPWHPQVVPGASWGEYYRRQRRLNNERLGVDGAERSPDPRLVDPPPHSD